MTATIRPHRRSIKQITTVSEQQRYNRSSWWQLYLSASLVLLVISLAAAATAPQPFAIAFLALLLGTSALLIKPAVGVYLIAFFTMAGDAAVAPWYPFAKNFSSAESILYLADPLTISPLEVLVLATATSWLLRSQLTDAKVPIRGGKMFVPLALFTGMVVVGFVNGIILRGGDLRVAIFEGRALFLILAVYLLIVNVLTKRRNYVTLFVVALVGVFVQSIIALIFYRGLEDDLRGDLDSLTEHGASVHLGVVFILTLCLIFFPKCSSRWRFMALMFCIPAVIVFALSQRRSAFNALAIAMVLFLVVLYVERRRAFWWFAPTVVILGIGYVLAFWNTTGPLGFGSQAVKSFIAPEQLDSVDRSSDLYREIEATNIWFTIRSERPLGVGFGNRFYQPWTLPDLGPGFEFRDFLPHNSLLWIWLKTGYIGFMLMLFILARTIQLGTRSISRVRAGNERAILVACLSYIVMYTVFTYVDIGWDARSVVFLAIAMAWCADAADLTPSDTFEPADRPAERTDSLVASVRPTTPEPSAALTTSAQNNMSPSDSGNP